MGFELEDELDARSVSPAESQEEIGLYLYLGTDNLRRYLLTEEELDDREAVRLQIQSEILTLYQNGVPCFSRSAIQNLVHQIDDTNLKINNGEPAESLKFIIPKVNGSTAEIEVETGTTHPNYGGHEVVMTAPFLYYRSYQHLIAICTDPREFYPRQALCPLQICYFAQIRDPRTNQLLPALRPNPLEEVREAFKHGFEAWKSSEDCKHVETILRTLPISSVSRVIAFGNGTTSTKGSQHSILQHALMLTIRDNLQLLQASLGITIQCFAQDPIYTEIDKEILQEVGITVLDDPRAFLEVSDESVVLSFGPDIPVRQIVTDISRPAVFICDKVRKEQELLAAWSERLYPRTWASIEKLEARLGDPESPRLRDLIQREYEDVGKLDDQNFAGATIYIRKPGIGMSK